VSYVPSTTDAAPPEADATDEMFVDDSVFVARK